MLTNSWGPRCGVLAAFALMALASFAQDRPAIDLDGVWQFRMDPEKTGKSSQWFAPGTAFEDSIRVPGAWESQGFGQPTDKLNHHFIGKSWYRRTVDVPAEWEGKRLFLCVGGVRRYAEVWVNGQPLGEHIGYVAPFEFDLTGIARPGAAADICICVDSEQRNDIDTLIGCFDIIDYMDTYWGGIWGHVRLEARSEAYLDALFVKPRAHPTSCEVTAEVVGDASAADSLELTVFAPDGSVLAQATQPLAGAMRGGEAAIETDVPGAPLWSPDSPNLCHVRLRLLKGRTALDGVETRFGFRQIELQGEKILLNGTRIFLHGYGDDCVYPETMAAPSDKETYLRRLAIAKDLGFNHVRHHSTILPPEYFDACDEMGILVSPELPIAYQQFYDRASEAALALYKTQWAAAIRRLRNHPSIFDWCMGNEMYRSVPIAPDLYQIAKDLDPTRPVVDSDGVWLEGIISGETDRNTLDLYFMQFDVFQTPLDIPDKFACPALKKPVVSHETGNYVTFPRLDIIELFQHNFKPFWLTPVRDRIESMGLSAEAGQWATNSEKLYMLCHKSNIEALRKNPNISGHHWWLLQDYWTTTNGIVDTYYRIKPGIDLDLVRRLNASVLLLEDGLGLTYRAGESLTTSLLVSNFAPAPLTQAVLEYRVVSGEKVVAEEQVPLENVSQGTVTALQRIELALPEVSKPERVQVEADLIAGDSRYHNQWTTWVYPSSITTSLAPGKAHATPEVLPAVRRFGVEPMPGSHPLPTDRIYITSLPSAAMLDAVHAGGCLILLQPASIFASVPTRFKTAWWRGTARDNTAGTLVRDHPVTRDIAPDGWCDTGWYRLLESSQGFLLDDLPATPDVIVRGIEVLHACRNKAMLFQTRLGQGTLIVSGLNLDPEHPEAEWILAQLIEYGLAPESSSSELPIEFLRPLCADLPSFDGPVIDGFSALTRNDGEEAKYFSYRETEAPYFICRQLSAAQAIQWETAPVPAGSKSGTVTFVFAGGLGWNSQPRVGGFTLFVNDKEALVFDVERDNLTWNNKDTGVSLVFAPRKVTHEDRAGLFYLTVPSALARPGKLCTLTVRSAGSGSQRWFGLNPYTGLAEAGK